MKTVHEVLQDKRSQWEEDEWGIVMHLPHDIEVRIEPLLFGASYLGVYKDTELIGEKLPITLGTPAQRRQTRNEFRSDTE